MKTYYFTESVIQGYTITANSKEEAIKIYEDQAGSIIKPDSKEYIEDSTYIYDPDGNQLNYYGADDYE